MARESKDIDLTRHKHKHLERGNESAFSIQGPSFAREEWLSFAHETDR